MKRLLLLLIVAPATLFGQLNSMESQSSGRPLGSVFFRTDSVELGLRTRSFWRGFDLGTLPLTGGLHMGLWQIDGVQDKHAIIGRAVAALPLAHRSRSSRRDLSELYAGYRYRIDSEQGEADLGYTDRRFGFSGGATHRRSIEATLQHRVDAPLTELRPILGVAVAREIGSDPTTWVEGKFVLEAGLPPTNNNAASYGGRIELRPAFSNFPRAGETTKSMGFHQVVLGIWLSGDRSSTIVGPLLMEVGGEMGWTRVPDKATYGLAGLRFVVR